MFFTIYLGTVVVAPFIFGLATINETTRTEVHIRDHEDLISFLAFCLFWPIGIAAITYQASRDALKESLKHGATETLEQIGRNDRSGSCNIVNIAEADLKVVLKAHRKKFINLSNAQVDMIRNELLNRNMERDLLK
jgi:hypothetical protein